MAQAASGVFCPPGIRMWVPQLRHLTVLPRATVGTASTLRQLMLGHMIRMVAGFSAMAQSSSIDRKRVGRHQAVPWDGVEKMGERVSHDE